jgi:hypothetical protein
MDADTFAISETRPDEKFLRTTLLVNQQSSDILPTAFGLLSSPSGLRAVAVVDRTANLQEAATDLVSSRFALNGRSPYAPDMVLVNQFCMQPFIELVIKHAAKLLTSDGPGPATVPKHGKEPSMLDKIGSENGVKVIVSGTSWAVVKVHNRWVDGAEAQAC